MGKHNKKFKLKGEVEYVKLADLCLNLQSGGTPKSTNKEFYTGKNKFLSISDINGKFLYDTKKRVSDEAIKNSSAKLIKNGTIIYTLYASPGVPFITKVDLVIPQSVISLEIDKLKITNNYLYYHLIHSKKTIMNLTMTGTQSNLSGDVVKNIKIVLVTYDQQIKIGNLLSSIDNLIEVKKNTKLKLELKKKYYLNEIFGDSKFKLKDDVEYVKLGDVVSYTSSSLNMTKVNSDGMFDVYGANCIVGKTDKIISSEDYISIVKDGAGVGRVLYCKKNTNILGTMGCIKSIESVSLNYLLNFMKNITWDKYIVGSTIPHVYFSDYKNNLIPLPTTEQQNKIGNLLASIDNLIELSNEEIKELELKKKYYLNEIFG